LEKRGSKLSGYAELSPVSDRSRLEIPLNAAATCCVPPVPAGAVCAVEGTEETAVLCPGLKAAAFATSGARLWGAILTGSVCAGLYSVVRP